MLQKLIVVVPVMAQYPRDDSVDEVAKKAADKLSATPVKDFRFVERQPHAVMHGVDRLLYEAWGTPKEENDG